MFGIGANELVLILIFGFIIFGPDKLPAMAKTVGQAIAKFRRAQNEMSQVIKSEVYDPTSDDPFKNPLDAISKLEKKVSQEDDAESFSDRKARYEKQREAQKRMEERKAELAERKAQAKARLAGGGEGAEGPAEGADAALAEAAPAAEEPAPKPRISVDDLYGVTPVAPKTAPKADAADNVPATEEKGE